MKYNASSKILSYKKIAFCMMLLIYAMFNFSVLNSMFSILVVTLKISVEDMSCISSVAFYSNLLSMILFSSFIDTKSYWWLIKIILLFHVCCLMAVFIKIGILTIVVYRIATGVMVGMFFPSCLRIVINQFPEKKGLLVSLLLVSMGGGSILAQAPVVSLLHLFKLDFIFFMFAFCGFTLFLVTLKQSCDVNHNVERYSRKISDLYRPLIVVCKDINNWILAMFVSLINLPIFIFGDLFGIIYLINNKGVSEMVAASIISMLFLGYLVGTFLIGFIVDNFNIKNKVVMLISVVLMVAMINLLNTNLRDISFLHTLFFIIGMIAGSQLVAYYLSAKTSNSATSASLLSCANVLIGGLAQQFVGHVVAPKTVQSIYEKNSFSIIVSVMAMTGILNGIFLYFYTDKNKISTLRQFKGILP